MKTFFEVHQQPEPMMRWFAKRDATQDTLVGLVIFDHNFHRPHQVLRLPAQDGVHRYQQ